MSKKISAEIRHQVLLLLRQGARAQSIATQLRLTKSWVQQCQYRFDLGDLTWLDPTYRSLVTPELALRAVREYEICRNYAQAARIRSPSISFLKVRYCASTLARCRYTRSVSTGSCR